MAKSARAKPAGVGTKAKATARPPLPDPKIAHGPYRPFTSDPGWSEAWWWLGVPVFVAAFALGTYWIVPAWYVRYVLPEGYSFSKSRTSSSRCSACSSPAAC